MFRDRRSQRLKTSAALPGMPSIEEFQRWLDREFFECDIDAETCIPHWQAGDRMDWNMAVSGMFQ